MYEVLCMLYMMLFQIRMNGLEAASIITSLHWRHNWYAAWVAVGGPHVPNNAHVKIFLAFHDI